MKSTIIKKLIKELSNEFDRNRTKSNIEKLFIVMFLIEEFQSIFTIVHSNFYKNDLSAHLSQAPKIIYCFG